MTTNSSMIAALSRLSGREMLITTETADLFISNLTRMAATAPAETAAIEASSRSALCLAYGFDDSEEATGRKSFIYQDGVAVIPIHGSLINRFGGSWGFVTGYNFIRRQMNAALDDEDVKSIVFDVDSPGGEASGCFELAREILASRRVKPSLAMVDSVAASGGMALAGCATKMYGIPSARIGSIGVYRQHMSIKGALEQDGVKITFAVAGEHKLDGSPFEDLPESVLSDWTTEAEKTWDDFIELVAEARDMEPEAVRATQAKVFRADEALALGLINDVKSTTEAVPAFIAEIAADNPSDDEEEDEMTEAKKGSEVTSDQIAGLVATGIASAMSAQRSRRNAIVNCDEAKQRPKLAAHFADNTDMSPDDAKAALGAAAVETKGSPADKIPLGKGKGKGKAKVEAEPGEDDEDGDENADDGEDGDENADDGEDGDENGEQEARDNRSRQRIRGNRGRDNVNHLDQAMGRERQPKVGAGGGKDGGDALTGDALATATLLGDHSIHTGAQWGKKRQA